MTDSSLCVLVIEHAGYINKHFRLQLEARFGQILFVQDLADAKILLEKGKPDLVIVDSSDGINTYNTLMEMRNRQTATVPFITILDRTNTPRSQEITETGHSKILFKPIDPEQFSHAIDQLLDLLKGDRAYRKRTKQVDTQQHDVIDPSYREFVEGTDDLIVRADGQGRFTYVNHKALDIFGIPPEACVGHTSLDFIHPDDREKTTRNMQRWIEEKRETAYFENRQVHRDGSVRHMLWTLHLHFDEKGSLDHINGIASDITRIKEYEAQLLKTSRELTVAQKIANIGSFECPLDMKKEEFKGSRQLYEIFGLEPKEEIFSLEDLFDHYIHPADKKAFLAHREALLTSKKSMGRFNVRILKKDNSYRYATFYCHPLYDENGNPYKVYGAVQDVTHQVETEEALRQSEKDYEAIFNATKDAIFIHDMTTGEIKGVNQSAVDLFGYDREAFQNVSILELSGGVAPYSQTEINEHLQQALNKESHTFEWLSRRKDGSLFWSEITLKKIFIRDGDYITAHIRDISERKASELLIEEQLKTEKFLTEITGDFVNIDHALIDRKIEQVLEKVARHFHVDSSYIFLIDEGDTTISNTHKWVAPDTPWVDDELIRLPLENFSWSLEQLHKRQIIAIEDTDLLPPGAKAEREIFKSFDVKSYLMAPMILENHFKGFIAIDTFRDKKDWSDSAKTLLTTLGSILTNVLEKQQAMTQLSQSESNYLEIFNATNEGFLIHDADQGTIIDANTAAEKLFGYSKEELKQLNVVHLSYGESPYSETEALAYIKQALESGQCRFEWYAKKKDGTLFWIEVNLKRAILGNKQRIIAALWDTTEEKANRIQLEESEKKLRTIFDNASEGIMAADLSDKHFIFANPKMCEMLGYSEEELLKLSVDAIHPEEELPFVIDTFEKQARKEMEVVPALPMKRKDGTVFYVENTTSVVDNVERPYMIGIFKDITETRRLLNELIETKEDLTIAQAIAKMGTFEHDPATLKLYFSESLQKILGLPKSKARLSSDEFQSMLEPTSAAALRKDQQEAARKQKKTDRSEVLFRRPDGKLLHIVIAVTIKYNENGAPLFVRGLMQDITEQRVLENELRESEENFRTIVEMTNTVPWRYDLVKDCYTYVGPQIKALWGYAQAEWQDATIDTWYGRIHPDDRDEAKAFCLEETVAGRDHTLEFRAVRSDGGVTWIKESISVVSLHGKPTELIGYMFDINDQKEAELALQESEELFRTLSENIITGIILYSCEKIIYVNPAAQEILGYKQSTLKKQFAEKRLTANLQKILTDEKQIHGERNNLTMFYKEIAITTKGDKQRWIQIETNAVTYRAEAVRMAVFTDITDEKVSRDRLKETTQQLQEFNTNLEKRVQEEIEKNRKKEQMMLQQSRFAQMGEMLSMIAHQWRQPLNAISATAINLRLDNQLGETDGDAIESRATFIEKQAERMSETINDFMELFRPAKKQGAVRLLDAIQSVNKIIGAQMHSRDIHIAVDVPADMVIMGTLNELEHVILNLISNARDAFEGQHLKNKTIRIHAERKNRKVILTVSDNAGGIPPEILERIFDAYFTTKLDGKGTGIGLYMTKTIVERNFGGTIEATNSQEGAVFTIIFEGDV